MVEGGYKPGQPPQEETRTRDNIVLGSTMNKQIVNGPTRVVDAAVLQSAINEDAQKRSAEQQTYAGRVDTHFGPDDTGSY